MEDLAQEMSYILFEKANQGLLSSLRTINQKNYIDVSRIRARVVGVEGTHADHYPRINGFITYLISYIERR